MSTGISATPVPQDRATLASFVRLKREKRPLSRIVALAAMVVSSVTGAAATGAPPSDDAVPMSFSNRQLLNRAAVYGQQRIEVMVLTDATDIGRVKSAVAAAGGSVRHEIPAIDYLRVELPISVLKTLVTNSAVVSYQIASNANMIWDQEGRTEDIATMYRGYEVDPIVGKQTRIEAVLEYDRQHANLPLLSPAQARGPGYTAEDETGVTRWLATHPRWDGRGVTIALLESGLPEFDHPTLRDAKDLQGQPTPKIAGFANTVAPESEDQTRVSMSTVIRSQMAWYSVANRTYILPRPGTFRFGMLSVPVGGNLRQDFAVLWDTMSGEIWVDSDGDASFRNEKPMRDVNERLDVGRLKFTQPSEYTVSFVVATSSEADVLNVYTARGGHQAMTASVAAGSRTADGLASGVAPNARILFVRNQESHGQAYDFVEGYAEIAGRPDVDVLSDSRGIDPLPDMAEEFYSLIFTRLASAYRKPVFHSGGNDLPGIGVVSSLEGVFAVGGSISPATYAALYGGAQLERTLKHPFMSEGPGGDGGFKPDFLAPMHRISADRCANVARTFVPKNAPTAQLPPCYQISCCTSASGPYAAGVAALLISASRQNHDELSLDDLGRALRAGAQYLPDTPAYAQGAGVLDINAAWKELHRKAVAPQIHISAPVVQAMVRYARHPGEGGGLFEIGGWKPGQSGERVLSLRRDSGLTGSVSYRVSWTGNDGTFASPRSVQLPLNATVRFPLTVRVNSFGPHSAILNLHDPATDAIVFRSLATVVAPQPVPRGANLALTLNDTVPLMRSRDHFIAVPPGSAALRIDLDVKRGALSGRMRSRDPTEEVPNRPVSQWGAFEPGKHTWVIPNPSAGTWSLSLTNDTGWREKDPAKVSTEEAVYSVSFSILNGDIEAATDSGRLSIQAENRGADLGAPAADVYPAVQVMRSASLLESGEPNIFPIDVPEDSGLLRLRAKTDPAAASDIELFLYDCTSGQCFLWDYAGTAAREQVLTVHQPKAGKWVLAANAAPAMVGRGSFVLEEIIGGHPERYPLNASSHWQTTANIPRLIHSGDGEERVLYCELVDARLQEAESKRLAAAATEETPADQKGPARPVAIASTIYRLE